MSATSSSSTCPRSAVKAYGIPPFSRIQATATAVSSPPEKAMPMRSPTGSACRTRLTGASRCDLLHGLLELACAERTLEALPDHAFPVDDEGERLALEIP